LVRARRTEQRLALRAGIVLPGRRAPRSLRTRYNQAAKPFKWKFTTTDLADFLDRLDHHQSAISTHPAQPRAA